MKINFNQPGICIFAKFDDVLQSPIWQKTVVLSNAADKTRLSDSIKRFDFTLFHFNCFPYSWSFLKYHWRLWVHLLTKLSLFKNAIKWPDNMSQIDQVTIWAIKTLLLNKEVWSRLDNLFRIPAIENWKYLSILLPIKSYF